MRELIIYITCILASVSFVLALNNNSEIERLKAKFACDNYDERTYTGEIGCHKIIEYYNWNGERWINEKELK